MTFSIDLNVMRTILRINVGWMIWAGCLAVQQLVAMNTCEPTASRAWMIAAGVIAIAGAIALLYRLLSDVRVHRSAYDSPAELAVDYLAGTVAALSLLGIVGSTWVSSTASLCTL